MYMYMYMIPEYDTVKKYISKILLSKFTIIIRDINAFINNHISCPKYIYSCTCACQIK